MKILGIDPALTTTGWGIISYNSNKITYIDSGIIKTDAKRPIAERLLKISNDIKNIIEMHLPEKSAIEKTFVNNNPYSSLKLAHARGAIMSILAQQGLQIEEYSPNFIKKAIVGSGHAEKEQIIRMLKILLPLMPLSINNNAADALACAICSAHFSKFKIL